MINGAVIEQRSAITVESRPLLCIDAAGEYSMKIPANYVAATIVEMQAALDAVIGGRTALIVITIEAKPYADILGMKDGH